MLNIGDIEFSSRLFLGTGKFSSNETMEAAILSSGTQLVTVALRRVDMKNEQDDLLQHIRNTGATVMPNTSGVRTAKEAVFLAKMAREALETNWLKLEIHPDPRYLLPDPIETLKAAEELAKDNFIVMPYVNADPVLCKRLEDVGVASVMPLGAPIGSNRGLETRAMLEIIIKEANVPVVVDAGIGLPSHASDAMEMGASAVLVNTAIAIAQDPVKMAESFKLGVQAGELAFENSSGFQSKEAIASSPLTAFLDE